MSKKYYATRNTYASKSSRGFSNTWFVLAFADRKSRDDYVEAASARDISVYAIPLRVVTSYINEAPRKFTDDHYCIDPRCNEAESIDGCLGGVTTYYHSSACGTTRLFG